MEVSKNDTLELIRKCMQEVRKRIVQYRGKDIKLVTHYSQIERNGSIDYMKVEGLADSSTEIITYYNKYKELEKELFNMERTENNTNNTSNNGRATVEKFVVIEAINAVSNLAKEVLKKVEKAKDELYLKSVISAAINDLNTVNALDESDAQLDIYFNKYSSIYNKIQGINNQARQNASAENAASTSSIAFETSRNAYKYTKEDVIDLINDCKLNLEGLNAQALIATEDLPTWNQLMAEINADYNTINSTDPRNKKVIEVLYKKYTLRKNDIDHLVEELTSKANSNNAPKADIITKVSIIDKLEDAIDEIKEIIKNKKIRRSTRKALADLANTMNRLIDKINKLDDFIEQDRVKAADKKADKLIEELNSYDFNKRRVTGKIKEEDQNQITIDDRKDILANILRTVAILGVGALATYVILNFKGCSSDRFNNNGLGNNGNSGLGSGLESQQTNLPTGINIDVNNYEQLVGYATDIQGKLDPTTPLTIDDIVYCIRLANFDRLIDKAVFRERDEVCASTYNMGPIARCAGINSIVQKDTNADIYLSDETMLNITACATDLNVTRDDFEEAKTSRGYDIYTVCQICLDNMYGSDPDKAYYFCRIFNDITARLHQDFSIIPDCPISTRYVLAGMYTGNAGKILELTAGQVLGPIYGSGYRIDGTYGNMCVEELEAFMRINRGAGEAVGNENNMLYTIIIDENITNYCTQVR